jgi:hypothetical protein
MHDIIHPYTNDTVSLGVLVNFYIMGLIKEKLKYEEQKTWGKEYDIC